MFGRRREPDAPQGELSFFGEWTRQSRAPLGHAVGEVLHERRTRVTLCGILALAVGAALLAMPTAAAHADPSPSDWQRLRECESSDNYSINTGNGYYGAYQFSLSTWKSVGGTGLPSNASPAEQDARALILYRERGWEPWTCARILGLKDDKDAGSGKISDIHVPTSSSAPSTPASKEHYTGGSQGYRYGEDNAAIKVFQDEMHARGYFPAGTGQFGTLTLAMVTRLQALNGVPASGIIDARTWGLAWTGTFTPASSTAPAHTATTGYPAYPGAAGGYRFGQHNSAIEQFQNEMHARGYFPAGTGQFGTLTLAMVKRLQSLDGVAHPSGVIGPVTWSLAWKGKYSLPAPTKSKPAAPRFPSKTVLKYGQNDSAIKQFQNEMHARGYFPAGTGQFGTLTLAMVKQLQRLNGQKVTGVIGAATWALAWTGRYSAP